MKESTRTGFTAAAQTSLAALCAGSLMIFAVMAVGVGLAPGGRSALKPVLPGGNGFGEVTLVAPPSDEEATGGGEVAAPEDVEAPGDGSVAAPGGSAEVPGGDDVGLPLPEPIDPPGDGEEPPSTPGAPPTPGLGPGRGTPGEDTPGTDPQDDVDGPGMAIPGAPVKDVRSPADDRPTPPDEDDAEDDLDRDDDWDGDVPGPPGGPHGDEASPGAAKNPLPANAGPKRGKGSPKKARGCAGRKKGSSARKTRGCSLGRSSKPERSGRHSGTKNPPQKKQSGPPAQKSSPPKQPKAAPQSRPKSSGSKSSGSKSSGSSGSKSSGSKASGSSSQGKPEAAGSPGKSGSAPGKSKGKSKGKKS